MIKKLDSTIKGLDNEELKINDHVSMQYAVMRIGIDNGMMVYNDAEISR